MLFGLARLVHAFALNEPSLAPSPLSACILISRVRIRRLISLAIIGFVLFLPSRVAVLGRGALGLSLVLSFFPDLLLASASLILSTTLSLAKHYNAIFTSRLG